MAERDTQKMALGQYPDHMYYLVAAATTIEAGKIVCLNSAGHAVEGVEATGLRTVGRASRTVDNSAGSAGDESIRVDLGVFKFANSGTDAVDLNDTLNVCYVEDDQTVSETDNSAARSKAGRVMRVDSDGVWVHLGEWA